MSNPTQQFLIDLRRSKDPKDQRKRQFVYGWYQNIIDDIDFISKYYIDIFVFHRLDFTKNIHYGYGDLSVHLRNCFINYDIYMKNRRKYALEILEENNILIKDIVDVVNYYMFYFDNKEFLENQLLNTVFNTEEWKDAISNIKSDNWYDYITDDRVENTLRLLSIDIKMFSDKNQNMLSDDEEDVDY